ncbi:alpha/beta hydrolase [Embleya hyalina]|uniref:Esterase n=1 Tax=Embleya hyalina TaxID=516124 RepID=A0A401Z5W9_9ACTN|nr:alpha/beta hydrolase [Embleya hyalina]GCE02216.1 esterase [Embleya hyalina]
MDPEIAAALALLEAVDPYDLAAHRALQRRQYAAAQPLRDPAVDVDHLEPDGAGGPPVRLRTYRNLATTEPAPLVVWLHGGGFALGFCEIDDDLCTWLAAQVGCHIIAPEYRLAPEHPFPAGFDDAYRTLEWAVAHADELGVDTGAVVVAGASAGGALAAAVCQRARDEGGPAIRFQLLMYPVIDDRMDTHSMDHYTDTPIFDRSQAELMWHRYLGDERTTVSPYAAPGRAEDLSGLPPAYVLTVELDPLRDEGLDYALRMIREGVKVEIRHLPDAFHGFDGVSPSASLSQRLHADFAAVLRGAVQR